MWNPELSVGVCNGTYYRVRTGNDDGGSWQWCLGLAIKDGAGGGGAEDGLGN